MKTWVGPRNYYVLEGGRDLPMERGVRPIGNNNNNSIHICIAPYGRNFRGAKLSL